MSTKFTFPKTLLILGILILSTQGFSQMEAAKWKAQLSLGINHPDGSGYPRPFYAKDINFPTVNLGVQHMFKERLGAKLDFGFNRFSSLNDTPEFKTNYTRINAQIVYDASSWMRPISYRMGLVGHAGPGYSIIKPLGIYRDNTNSFLNAMAGIEVHYGITRSLSVFADTSFIYAFAKDFDPITDGYGSFNGNLWTFTVGVSVSLSGCYYCD
ncbi:outer membrane beta-barrel protein [Mangrovimonas sp. AS39]|uniref:outer membrane beta-barrel protein n=1 Tax=Mangrovimonas futianensis TaxID=2895523 RepID=UPI001E508064|nr:outer membrane beta-barrel protein [Mangrovimonas futianensis]MCF1190964.1 outer membrane beta-barrel protein [Mangrovimonas futianensis]MCF1194660.1 outer membrane beta-barrel protein [Mangrovimonas futianensis]